MPMGTAEAIQLAVNDFKVPTVQDNSTAVEMASYFEPSHWLYGGTSSSAVPFTLQQLEEEEEPSEEEPDIAEAPESNTPLTGFSTTVSPDVSYLPHNSSTQPRAQYLPCHYPYLKSALHDLTKLTKDKSINQFLHR